MKKRIFSLLIIFAITGICCIKHGYASGRDTIKKHFKILYILEFSDRPPMITANAYVDPQQTISMKDMPDSSSKQICKLLKMNFIVILNIEPKAKILTLDDVFERYKIPLKYRKLVKVDDEVLDHPETLEISQNQIDIVKVAGRYVDIILKGYYKK